MEVIPRNIHSNDGRNGNTSSHNHDNENSGGNIEKNNIRFHVLFCSRRGMCALKRTGLLQGNQ